MRRPALAFLALALAVAAAGCSSPCQELGDRICNCLPEGTGRTNCQTGVKNRLKAAKPSSAQEDFCNATLDTCPDPGSTSNACDLLNTCQGKVNCGLALPPPEGCPTGAQAP
jgi:hypothetical protein